MIWLAKYIYAVGRFRYIWIDIYGEWTANIAADMLIQLIFDEHGYLVMAPGSLLHRERMAVDSAVVSFEESGPSLPLFSLQASSY